jgi:hypothetical protein
MVEGFIPGVTGVRTYRLIKNVFLSGERRRFNDGGLMRAAGIATVLDFATNLFLFEGAKDCMTDQNLFGGVMFGLSLGVKFWNNLLTYMGSFKEDDRDNGDDNDRPNGPRSPSGRYTDYYFENLNRNRARRLSQQTQINTSAQNHDHCLL